jgi:SAM-dependent methyltransferase
MSASRDYLDVQRRFWNVDPHTSKFGRVDTVSGTEAEYEALADAHFSDICEGVEFTDGLSILEIGCGVGRLLGRMQRKPHANLTGVDISANMIEAARSATLADPRLRLFVNSGADLSMVESASVGFCYSNDVFIHIADVGVVSAYLSEVARVLRPGGLFRFNVRELVPSRMFGWSLGGVIARISYATGLRSGLGAYQVGVDGFSGLHCTPADARRLLSRAGLSCERIQRRDDPSEGSFLWMDCRRPG